MSVSIRALPKKAIGPCGLCATQCPRGAVSIVAAEQAAGGQAGAADTRSSDIENHTRTSAIRLHHAALNPDNSLARPDELFRMDEEPGHDELCKREQMFLLRAIREDLDLRDHLRDAVTSLRVVLAAEESIRNRQVVTL